MTSGLVSELLTNLGVTRSHSRPRISNDNPFSEAQFKTLKYLHDFPKSFASLQDARLFLEGFFNEYNHIHRHSGIGWHTPASVHFGTAAAIDDARQITLTAAYHANPARFGRRPTLNRPHFLAGFMVESSPAGMAVVERNRGSRIPRVGRARGGCAAADCCTSQPIPSSRTRRRRVTATAQ
jgi:hypothetical protein